MRGCGARKVDKSVVSGPQIEAKIPEPISKCSAPGPPRNQAQPKNPTKLHMVNCAGEPMVADRRLKNSISMGFWPGPGNASRHAHSGKTIATSMAILL